MNFRKIMMNILVVSAVLFATTNGFCEENSLVVDETGNVGIGTIIPAGKAHIETYDTGVAPNPDGDELVIEGAQTSGLSILSQDHGRGSIYFGTPSGNSQAMIYVYGPTVSGSATGREGQMSFKTGGADRMHINQGGNVGVGTSAPAGKVHIKTYDTGMAPNPDGDELVVEGGQIAGLSILSQDNGRGSVYFGTPSGNAQAMIYVYGPSVSGSAAARKGQMSFKTGGVDRMHINQDGNVGIKTNAPSYTLDVNGTIRGNNVSPSDARWKTNVAHLENALDKVSELRGVSYEWSDASKGVGEQMGVIAQEVEAVFPEAVSTDGQGYKSVAYAKLVAPLIEAVKELKKENAALKQRIEILENK